MKKVKGYKTIAYAGIVALTGFLASPEVAQWVADNLPWAATGVATGIVVLRAFTTSAMFGKE